MARELRRDQLGTYRRAMTAYGDVVRLAAGPPGRRVRLHLVTHPDGVQQVLAGNAANYVKDTPFYRELAAAVGDGLLTSDGRRWRWQRRTLAPLFAHGRIADYVPVMADEAVRLRRRWTAAAGSPARVDLHAEMVEYTLRVVGRALFGAAVDEAVPSIRATFPALSQQVRRRATAALPRPGRRLTAAQRALYAAVDAVVERRRRTPGGGHGDLVSLLLAARDPETGAPLSTQEVRDLLLIFLIAGHETTATALTFAWHLLGRHPDMQRRVQQEVDEVLGGRVPTAEDVPRLGYTTAVVNEALRLYPPASAFGRRSVAADRIGGYRIPPGSVVVLSPWATHRRPDLWPDPERFDPGRFGPAAASGRHRYAWFPFGGGPRACIGAQFALTEAVVATAVLLAGHELRSDAAPVPLATAVTLRPAGPVWCQVAARRPVAAAAALSSPRRWPGGVARAAPAPGSRPGVAGRSRR
jgi:cytochrome P450